MTEQGPSRGQEMEEEIAALRRKLRQREKELEHARSRLRRVKHFEERADILRTVFDSSQDSILIHTPEGKILDVNESFLELHGMSREQALELTIAELSDPTMSMEEAAEIWRRVVAGQDQLFEWKGRRYKDGAEFDAEIFLQRVTMSGRDLILAHVRDITRHKKAEADIAASREQLRQAYQLLEGVTEGTQDLIAALDGRYRFILFNRAYREEFERIFGRDIQVGDSLPEALAHLPEDRENAMKLWTRALGGESFTATQAFGEARLGRNIYEMRYSALKDAEGRLVGAAQIVRDVTAKVHAIQRLHKSEEEFRAFFENAAVGAVKTDLDGRFLRANARFCKIVGYRHEELLERSIFDLTDPRGRGTTRESVEALLRGEIPLYQTEKRYIRKNGQVIWVAVSTALVRDKEGTPLHLVGVIQDITDRKRLEIDLLSAKQMAEEANQAKSQFLANMSHELRTPMTVIMSSLELLRESSPTAEQKTFLEMADVSSQRLLGIIDDLLDISRIESRRLEIETHPFELRKCVRQAVEIFRPSAQEKGLDLDWAIDPALPDRMEGDAVRLGQVLINLVGNAVKFTPGGEVSVAVKASDGEVLFSIRDTGIGIPQEKIDYLFQPFMQVDSSMTRAFGGSGLGLAISKELVNMMGGTITVESGPGEGSVFTFTIPLRPAAVSGEPCPGEPLKKTLGHARILLAEDDPAVQKLVGMMLESRGVSLEIAQNGREAVSRWQDGGIDMVLMDVQMPVMNGLEATRQIRELEAGRSRRTCIFALTAHVREEDRRECLEAGMDGFLGKPFSIEELNRIVESCPCGLDPQ